MGNRKRRRSSSSESTSSDSDRARTKFYGSRRKSVSVGREHVRRDERRANPKRQDSPALRGISRTEERASTSRQENGDDELNTRLNRLECLLETFLRRESKRGEEKPTRYKVKSDCIPEFEPGNPNLSATKWLNKIDQLAEINDWDEKTIIYYMQNRLKGLAKTWYGNLSSYDRSWDEWKKLIVKSFPEPHDFAKSLRKLVNRKKERNETMIEYYFAKMNLIQACNISGKDAVSCLIDGLHDPTVKMGAKAGRYNSPEELYSEFLANVSVNEKYSEYTDNRDTKYFKNPRMNGKSYNDRKELKQRETNGIFKCFNCSEKGHTSRNCDKPKVECTNCNRLGHDARNCKKPKATVKIANDVSSTKSECYYVNCKINGKCFRGFIDTGCSAVLLREKEAKELNLKTEPCSMKINGYGGGSASIVGKALIRLEVDLATATVEVLIVPNIVQEIPLLVGQTFLNDDTVSFAVRDNMVRIFNKESVSLPELDSLPPTKVLLWAKSAKVIPPNSVAFVECKSDNEGDVYVENSFRNIPNMEHWICGGVLRGKEGGVAVVNTSHSVIRMKEGQLLARGTAAGEEDTNKPPVSTFNANVSKLVPFIIDDIEKQVDKDINLTTKQKLLTLLNKYRHCFAQNLKELGKTHLYKMKINLKDENPISYKPYRMAYSERENVRGIIEELLENNIIRESNSPFSSPILLVKKKTGEYRMCVDYRKLNSQTIKDAYPIPRIDDQIERLKGCRYFTSLDLASGYHQIPIHEESIYKTAFITPDGHYEYLRMPFGLANAPAVFQRTINSALGHLRFTTALAYMDDVLIPTEQIENAFVELEKVLKCLNEANLTLKLQKCFFFKNKIEYLGYEVSFEGIQPGHRKISAVSEFPQPCNVHQVRQFIGLASYFRKFIYNFDD